MNATRHQYPFLSDSFSINDGCLAVGGEPVRSIVQSVGKTPIFVYSKENITSRLKALKAALPEDVQINYAVKANPMPDIVKYMSGRLDGADVASIGELRLAIKSGFSAANVSIAGPGKTNETLVYAAKAGALINLESSAEMNRLAEIAVETGLRPRVAIRVNPAFELRRSGMQMGGGAKPFGIDEEQVPGVLAELARLPLDFCGFHIFSGSQNLDTDALIDCQKATIDLALQLSKFSHITPKKINLGGGFGIPYFPGDQSIDLNRIGLSLRSALNQARALLPDTIFAFEFGRFLVGEAGIYVSKVVDRKISRGKTFLITDGGLHHHLALSGNFGQVVRKNYPVGIVDKADWPAVETVDVVGCLCSPLDRMADAVQLPVAEVGDLFVVFQSGAYALTASPINFLGHDAPAEVLV